jgi:GH15 family glucan-1,4-alpha-glucosidase
MSERDVSQDRDYPPIGDYAAIGNCRTIALISRQGSLDWLCLPHFSAPSLFAALLDARGGGRFALRPRDVISVRREYLRETNVLTTEFVCAHGTVRLTDFFSVLTEVELRRELHPEHQIIRRVECVQGAVQLDILYQPRPGYARRSPALIQRGKLGWLCQHNGLAVYLQSTLPLAAAGPGTLTGSPTLHAGARHDLILSYCQNDAVVLCAPGETAERRLASTVQWWRGWCGQCTYSGPYRDAVLRSALTLKLLTYCLSGAVVAAATTSLPEGPTGERNWDYRYCWLRDTSLVLQSFIDLGFVTEARAFLGWLLYATRLTQPRLQVLYDVYGETALPERTVRQLEGYQGKGPVRIGNAAHSQLQLDVYGDVVLTACSFVRRGGELDRYERELVTGFGRAVCQLWRLPDASIWEIRGKPRHNTYSKLMCWVALDRLVELNGLLGMPASSDRLRGIGGQIREEMDRRGFDAGLNSYVGYFGGRDPDASLLLLARYGYIRPDDPRMLGTVACIERMLTVRDGLLYRYPAGAGYDGVPGSENAFALCSFWLVDYLARLGDVRRACALFERLLVLANDVGLYAEEFGAEDGRPLGNFPQAFSHVGLITAALALSQAHEGKRGEAIAQ